MKTGLQNRKTLLIVTGGSGTGKSRMATELLLRLSDDVVRISYDDVKEATWDEKGFDGPEEKKRLADESLEVFYGMLDRTMEEERPVLIEYPFYQFHRERLRELIQKNGYEAVTVYLHTDPKTAYERGIKRDADGRHPGHLYRSYHKEDALQQAYREEEPLVQTYEEFLAFIEGRDYNVSLGRVIDVDVTDYSAVSYDRIAEAVSSAG